MRISSLTLLLGLLVLTGCDSEPPANPRLHIFYYGWYANEETDGELAHWNHRIMGRNEAPGYPGHGDIGANFYPELGEYSSNDPEILEKHLKMMRRAGTGVIVASWWGPDSFEDRQLPALLDGAARHGLQVAFHLEPFAGRNAETTREALRYLIGRYGAHPACARWEGLPIVYVYDSYLTPFQEWARLLQPNGEITIRNTEWDAVMIGLWVKRDERQFFVESGFDGFYTYFAADGFTYGSTAANWLGLAQYARDHKLLIVPCVGPGYLDTRIRPWNAATTRDREAGAYFDRMFAAAVATEAPMIGVTSFNEWHEGTQIEPAVPKQFEGYSYQDYTPLAPDAYLQKTSEWSAKYQEIYPIDSNP